MTINIKLVDEYPKEFFDILVKKNLEADGIFIPSWEYYFEGDCTFEQKGKTVRVGAYDGDKLIGLSWGRAETKNRFMMYMSLVEGPYRGQGIYKRMLEMIIENTKEFDEVDSCHHILNNKILVLKLKEDFHIIGMDNTTMLGPRVKLRYFHNKKLFEIMKYRVGLRENPVSELRN